MVKNQFEILRKTVFPLLEGRRLFCGFYLLGQNSQSFRLCSHPCMKEADFKEEKGKYVEMAIRANTVDGEMIVHAEYDPFTLTLYKADQLGSNDRNIVFHAPKESLRFKPAGGMDDYHIAWRSANRYIIPIRFLWK